MEEKNKEMTHPYVLLVEDDSFLRMLLLKKFTGEGFEVVEATDGKEGMQKMIERKPDVVLLDILLPDINGFDVLEYMRGSEGLQDVPVLIISNLGSPNDFERSKKLGADGFLIKANVSTTEIVNKTREILSGK